MPIHYGTSKITGISYGSSPVKEAYYGKDLVWQNEEKLETIYLTGKSLYQSRDQLRNELNKRGLDYTTVKKLPFIIDCSSSTDLSYIFSGCSKLIQSPILLNTSNITTIERIFNDNSELTLLPFFDTKNVKNMSYSFYGCRKIKTIPKYNYNKVLDFNSTFRDCYSLTDQPDIGDASPSIINSIFSGCINIKNFTPFNTSNVTVFDSVYSGCSNLRSIPELDISKGTSFKNMFSNCIMLEKFNMDFKNSSDLYAMLLGCTQLKSAIINCNLELKANFTFQDCKNIESIVLNSSNVIDSIACFRGCTSLKNVSNIKAYNTDNYNYMFRDCESLTDGNVKLIGRNQKASTTDMIKGSGLTRLPFYDEQGNPIP